MVWTRERGRLVVRRDVLRHGLLGLAALAARPLSGCADHDALTTGVPSRDPNTHRTASHPRGRRGKTLIEDAGVAEPVDASAPDAPPSPVDAGKGKDSAVAPPMRDGGSPSRLVSDLAAVGPLGVPDANGVRLPPGFTCRVVARTGAPPVAGDDFLWHIAPDGGATFPTLDGGYVYVSNAEGTPGGAGALRFDARGEVTRAYSILWGSRQNCAGGATPWGTWLSCEEVADGAVFECDPLGIVAPVRRPALGLFTHEGVTVDPIQGRLYLTEDVADGCFYRFTPASTEGGALDLSSGTLEAAVVAQDGKVTWRAVPDPELKTGKAIRYQVPGLTPFSGGEGIVYFEGIVFFSTKGDNRIWRYDTETATLSIFYDIAKCATPFLSGVDNLTVTANGDVLVAEDAGDMEVVAILEDGSMKSLLQVMGQDNSELTGLAFDPSGRRLYVSSQRGLGSGGITYEISGPFHVKSGERAH
jgi:hypothetical protein